MVSFFVVSIFILSFSAGAHGFSHVRPPFLITEDMCGIWKISQSSPVASIEVSPETGEIETDDIVLRLNEDGTFIPFSFDMPSKLTKNDLHFTLCRGGLWKLRDNSLVLAVDRAQSQSKNNDTILVGKVQVQVQEDNNTEVEWGESGEKPDLNCDVHLSVPEGQVCTGRYMYPKKHKEFFEDPMLLQSFPISSCRMSQVLGNITNRIKGSAAKGKTPSSRFRLDDLYNRTFYLTATPHPVNKAYAQQDIFYDEEKALLDITIMPISFYSNNTFAAKGAEKILRGRFGITGDEGERLWFQVSLFGAGRSAPGSVYSEGRLLSKDDQRGYVGEIQAYPGSRNETILFVDGEFYYGEDLKQPKKTRSWGSFTLQEISHQDPVLLSDEDYEDNDDEGVFL